MATVYPETNQWLMAEDEALKALLSGRTVVGDKAGRKVPVYFRFPEAERQIIFPFITIDLIAIEPAYDLWQSEHDYTEDEMEFYDLETGRHVTQGLYEPSVNPSVFDVEGVADPGMPFRRKHYLQYRLFYQVTTWARTFAQDRMLTSSLIRDIFKPRPSWIYVEADHTVRRFEVLGWQPADIPTQEGASKRIFRKAFTISIQSEITQDSLPHIQQSMEVRRVALQGFYQTSVFQTTTTYWTDDDSHILPGDEAWEILHDEGPGGPITETLGAFTSNASGTIS